MNATTAEKWISQAEIGREEIGNDRQNYDQIAEVDSVKDSKIFSIVDFFLKPRTGWQVPDVFIRMQGSIMETCGVFDDVYVARSEKEKTDLIERLKEETKRMDTKK